MADPIVWTDDCERPAPHAELADFVETDGSLRDEFFCARQQNAPFAHYRTPLHCALSSGKLSRVPLDDIETMEGMEKALAGEVLQRYSKPFPIRLYKPEDDTMQESEEMGIAALAREYNRKLPGANKSILHMVNEICPLDDRRDTGEQLAGDYYASLQRSLRVIASLETSAAVAR